YAFLVHGLLNLHDATGDKKWLDEAKALADAMLKWYADEKRGGFYYTAHDHEKLFARAKESYDGAQPSGNGAAARDLLRLGRTTGEAKYTDLGVKTIKAFAGVLKASPSSVPGLARALDEHLDATPASPGREPGVVGKADAPKSPRESADVVKAGLKTEPPAKDGSRSRSEEHTSELQSRGHLVCRLLLAKKYCGRYRDCERKARQRARAG